MSTKFYAYILAESGESGVTNDWDKCKEKVNGVNSKYMSFLSEREAYKWVEDGCTFSKKEMKKEDLLDGIYFDSGKRGKKSYTRVRVTDKLGNDLLERLTASYCLKTKFVEDEVKINNSFKIARDFFGCRKILLNKYNDNTCLNLMISESNNVGELIGFHMACRIALSDNYTGDKKIFGDSKLVLDYWSKGVYNRKAIHGTVSDLIKDTRKLRIELEKEGYEFLHIPGGINPSDLGDHK
ncbi:MAG: viroplasmin family protein [Fusobacteriaceae bacterium]